MIRDVYGKLFDLLDRRERLRFLLLLGMILAMGLFEVVGVGSILPFLAVLADPSVIHENRWLAWGYAAGGFATDQDYLVALGIGVAVIVVSGLLFKTLTLYAMARYASMRTYSLGSRLLKAYLAQPYVWFLNRHSAELSRSVLGEVSTVVIACLVPAIRLIAFSVVALCLVGLIVIVDPVIALTAAAVIGTTYGLIFLAARRLLTRFGKARYEANGQRYKLVQEATGGIKDVKIRGLEREITGRYERLSWLMAHYQSLVDLIGEAPRHLLEAVLFGGMLVLLLQLMLTREGGLIEIVPVLGVYAFAGARLFPALQQIYQMLSKLRFGKPALDALHADMMALGREAPGVPARRVAPLGLADRIELRDVRYAYPNAERQALDGLSMEVAARTTVGIVGGTGAGKTTAVDVILGLLEPQSGSFLVDGAPLTGRARMFAWRRSIGYVPQHIYLTDDTVSANIAFGIPPEEIDADAVERAARVAELHDFVLGELPDGYATQVGERGVRLSGGQRQRIGIARALYHDPDVLLLDEATSALDNLTERAVMDAVRNIGHAKTIIMIAHRLTTVRACDEIFLLERGRVVARGSYDRLLEESTAFRRLAEGVA